MFVNFNDTHKERLLTSFKENRPMGMNEEDLEDVESELNLMLLEGIDLTNISVRDVMKRLGVL